MADTVPRLARFPLLSCPTELNGPSAGRGVSTAPTGRGAATALGELRGGDGDVSSLSGAWGSGGEAGGEVELCPSWHPEHLPALPHPGAPGPAGCPPPQQDPCAAQPPWAQPEPPLCGTQRAEVPARRRRAEISPWPQMPYRLAPVCTDIKVFASSCWRLKSSCLLCLCHFFSSHLGLFDALGILQTF